MTCSVEGCVRPVEAGGLCQGHRKRKTRGQTVSGDLRDDTRTPSEILTDAAIALADCDSDDDGAWARAQKNHQHAAESYAKRRTKARIRAALSKLKAEGVRLGRPVSVSEESVVQAVETMRTMTAAARALGVSRITVWRRRKGVSKT